MEKYLLLRHAFEELGAVRVQLKTDERDERSRRAIARLGARFEGVLRIYQTRYDGFVRNTALFPIVTEDWPVVRARNRCWLADRERGLNPRLRRARAGVCCLA